MPTYEYRCKSCGHELEVVQSFTDDALVKCPSCKKHQLRKVFGSIGITFKGSGFYKTDSRSGASSAPVSKDSKDSKESSTESSGSSSGADSGSGSTETKSGSTSEGKADTKSELKKPAKKDAAGTGSGSKAN